jgi:O-antigen ligase
MALVASAMILGGGGSSNPQTEMLLQLLTALLAFPLVVLPGWQRGLGPVRGEAWLLAGLVLLIPVAQLVPLPPAIWHALPGREVEIQALATTQADQRWMPLSVAPARTFAALLAMLCPVLLLMQVSRLSLRGRNWVCSAIVAVGVLSLLLGVLQLSHTGGWDWSFYTQFSQGYLVGFQANRNAEVDVFLICILAFGVLMATRLGDGRHHSLTWAGLMMGTAPLLVGAFMTGSRTGIALSVVVLLSMAVMLWPAYRKSRGALVWLGGLAIGLPVMAAGLMQLAAVRKVIDRFSLTHEARWDLWADTSYAIRQVWPFGSGVGTIMPMLEAAERLEEVDPTRPVRAHNDWLEWVLEGGLPGMIVLGLIAAVVGVLLVRALLASRGPDGDPAYRAQVIFAGGVLALEGLHSIVDYPMRSMSLAALTAVAVGFSLKPAAVRRNKP